MRERMAVQYYTDPEYVERLDGVDYPKVSPKATHAFVQGFFVTTFRIAGAEAGKCLPELRCRIGAVDGTKTHLIPDVAFITNERWNALLPAEREEPAFAPDIVVEIRSPGGNGRLRRAKVARYLATGATLVLDVDPVARCIHVQDARHARTLRAGETFRDARFPWLTFDAGAVFADLDG